ncbi:MAG: multidrug efflux pump, partial [Litorivivens sp.]
MNYVGALMSRSRTVISIFLVILLAGFVSYSNIPLESNPDV